MHPLVIPLGLLLLGSLRKGAANGGSGPQPTPPPGGTLWEHAAPPAPGGTPLARVLRKQLAAKVQAAKPAAPVAQPIIIDHPDAGPGDDAGKQAAVDAAVSHAIRADEARPVPQAPMPLPAPAPAGTRDPKQAAGELQQFLIKTGRFGSKKDRPAEVVAAQRDLGVKPDGIVGPKTRAAAAKVGVALPPMATPKRKR